jgi:hypothetical protein
MKPPGFSSYKERARSLPYQLAAESATISTVTMLFLSVLANLTFVNIGFATPPPSPPMLFVLAGGSVGTYDPTSGAVINANLIQAFNSGSNGLAVSGSAMFLINGNSIGKYNANFGTVINTNFIRPLFNGSSGLLVSGNTLFVTNNAAGTVGAYDATTGAVINEDLITVVGFPEAIAISGTTFLSRTPVLARLANMMLRRGHLTPPLSQDL